MVSGVESVTGNVPKERMALQSNQVLALCTVCCPDHSCSHGWPEQEQLLARLGNQFQGAAECKDSQL